MPEEVDPTRIRIDFDMEIMRGRTYHGDMDFEMPYITHVHENLWQGGVYQGLELPERFQHVISLYKWEDYAHGPLKTHEVVTMYDSIGVDEYQVESLAHRVIELLDTGEDVLVHCQAGLNRSSLVVARALMIRYGWEADHAIAHVRESRSPACLCNPSFETWLRLQEPGEAEWWGALG